jgi:hypothetical protein
VTRVRADDARIHVDDSITRLGPRQRGKVVVAASHGGVYCAYLAAKGGVRGVILNDAGVGLEGAGIGALPVLDRLGVPAAAASHASSRIGDGPDLWQRGVVSHVNAVARALGCREGQAVRACALAMTQAPVLELSVPQSREGQFLLEHPDGGVEIRGLDSVSLASEADAGHVAVCGSHGGVRGGDPVAAIRADVRAAAFNDAGIGIDAAGIARLPALDKRGIAAVAVDAMTARIGDARSMWQTGIVSVANATARAAGARPGQSLSDFCRAIATPA